MNKLVIRSKSKNKDTITRTIRLNGETFDKIMTIAEQNNLSFNNIVNQLIEYGINNLEK